jgi:hypothetical protein
MRDLPNAQNQHLPNQTAPVPHHQYLQPTIPDSHHGFITKLPSSYGHDTILTITDYDVSKACIFLPCSETIDAVSITALYATHVFPHYGIPLRIISDRDPHFDSKFTMELCKLLGIHQNISTAYVMLQVGR